MSFSQQQWRAKLPLLRRSSVVTLQLLTALHLVTTDLLEIRLCWGFSMLPTLSHDGDLVLISPIPVKLHTSSRTSAATGAGPSKWGINRGDVVIATSPTDPTRTVCKRIVGMEGDVIEIDPLKRRKGKRKEEEGSTERRWEQIDADHRATLAAEEREKEMEGREPLKPVFAGRRDGDYVKIPRGHVWLAGDNMSNSTDSRTYGPVPLGLVKGKVLARVWPWPPNRIGPAVQQIEQYMPPTDDKHAS